jgi:hypothetical protein
MVLSGGVHAACARACARVPAARALFAWTRTSRQRRHVRASLTMARIGDGGGSSTLASHASTSESVFERALPAATLALLALLTTKDALRLRTTCTTARAAVAAFPWDDDATTVERCLSAWHACFPRAVALGVLVREERTGLQRALAWTATALFRSSRFDIITANGLAAQLPLMGSLQHFSVRFFVEHDPGMTFMLGPANARVVIAGLTRVPQLRTLNLLQQHFGLEGAVALAAAMAHMPCLTGLNIGGNKIGDKGAQAVAAALVHVPLLAELNVRNNGLTAAGMRAFARAVQNTPQLEIFIADLQYVGDEGMRGLFEALARLPRLQELDVSSTGLGDDCAPALATALRALPRLAVLNVQCNELRVGGVRALADGLRACPSVTSLFLGAQRAHDLGTGGARILAQTLPLLPLLEWLDIGYNGLGEDDICTIVQALAGSPRFARLNASGNVIGTNGGAQLAAALAAVPTLTHIELWRCKIGDGGCDALTAAVAHLPRLKLLNLLENAVTHAAAVKLQRALPAGTELVWP